MKKYILCLIMVFMLCGCGNKIEERVDIDISDGSEYTMDNGISVKVDKFYYMDSSSTVNLIIKNNNDYDVYIGKYDVMVYDKDNTLIGSFTPDFSDVLKANTEINQMFSVNDDYSDGYKFEYVFDDVKENTSE